MGGEGAAGSPPVGTVDMKLEIVVLPVSDVDPAKSFYEGLGWRLDADVPETRRVPRGAADAARVGVLGHLRQRRDGGGAGNCARLVPGSSPISRRRGPS